MAGMAGPSLLTFALLTLCHHNPGLGLKTPLLSKGIRAKRAARASDQDYQTGNYPGNSRYSRDPQFPAYSNWQPADELGSFRINSPRRTDDDPSPSEEPPKPGPVKGDSDYIAVKLPADIFKHLGKQYGLDNNKQVQSQILGIPNSHLDHINFGDDDDVSDEVDEAIKKYPEQVSLKTTTTTTTEKSRNHAGYGNDREQEYYSKEDLIKQKTKDIQDSKMKVPEHKPLDPEQRSLWSVAWQAHIYFAGTLFILLAIYCTVNVCRLHTFSRLFSRGYFLSLNVCMIIIGLARGTFLLFDPYNEFQSLPSPVAYMLLNLGYPCITSAFAILFLALLRVTQVELLSPAVQTPRALASFCCIHLAVSLALDVTVGLVTRLQYILLLGQGIFIVWSLLLSAGYFYIYSTMKKVVSRQACELNRGVYPKLMFDQAGSGGYSMRMPPVRSNPLSRAVNLTLGVAVLGSLMGGVQLYGMIGMHGLLRANVQEIPDPWYGYQVALRVLEVMICYLLAVVATTPLRQDGQGSPRSSRGPCSSCSPLLCCNGEGPCIKCGAGDNQPAHLEEDIYTEISQVNHSVRVLNSADSSCYNQAMIPMGGSTQSANTSTLALSASGQQLTNTLQQRKTPRVAVRNSGGCTSQVSGDSSATLDTALYSNLRSRPSSMLFNDAGFVRFRLGNDPSLAQQEVMRQSCQDLTAAEGQAGAEGEASQGRASAENMKGSRSFDNSKMTGAEFSISGQERPQSNMSYVRESGDSRQIKSELCSPDRLDVEFLPGLPTRPASKLATERMATASPLYNRPASEQGEMSEQYEAPAGLILPGEHTKSLAAQVRSVVGYSESDLSSVDPLYGGKSMYGYSRAPSRCSSISATQSFDMRVYGATGQVGMSGAATLGRPVDKPKLDNKYYYYGSTRGQKKSSQKPAERETLTPRPLLPSQRAGSRAENHPPTAPPSRAVPQGPPPSQPPPAPDRSIYDQIMGREQPNSPKLPNFQRSRSLGHHYQQQGGPPGENPGLPPRHPAPRTPTSVARRVLESVTKRRSKDKHKAVPRQPYPGIRQDQMEQYMMQNNPQQPLIQLQDGRIIPAPGPLLQTEDGRIVVAPGPLVQLEDGRLVAVVPGPGQPGMMGIEDPRLGLTSQRARQGNLGRDQMLYGTAEEVQASADREAFNRAHAAGLLGDKLSYLPQSQDPVYERRADMLAKMPFGSRLGQGEIRQVLGTPPVGRHRPDSRQEQEQGARLAGHFLSSPPDLHTRRGPRNHELGAELEDSDAQSDHYTSQATQGYSEGLADNELDSEISSLFGPGDGREGGRLQNLHLMSPLEYAAMLKQYTEPSLGVLGQDITPDSGVVVDSRNHSKERDAGGDARDRRDKFVTGARKNGGSKQQDVEESSGESSSGSSSGSRGRNDSLLLRNGRYRRVPTEVPELEDKEERKEEGAAQHLEMIDRETEVPAFVWDGAKLVPTDARTLAKRHRQPSSFSETEVVTDSENVSESNTEYSDGGNNDTDFEHSQRLRFKHNNAPLAAEKISTVCNEIKQRFQSDLTNTDDENVI